LQIKAREREEETFYSADNNERVCKKGLSLIGWEKQLAKVLAFISNLDFSFAYEN